MSRSLVVWPLLILVLSPVWLARPDAGPATEPLSPGWPQAQSEVALALRNAAVHPHLGLPDFVVDGSDAELAGAARTVADVLRNDIDFEREFYLISRDASAAIPVAPADALPYDRWAELGADVVLAGSVSRNGSDMVIRLRLIAVRGTDRGRQVGYGQAYTNCSLGSPRACAHYISDDFLQRTRAVEGVARTKLAFVSDRDGERVTGRPEQSPARAKEVYISDYDGANQRRITSNHNLNIEPVWSPDGGRLAYVSYTAPPSDIFIMNLRDPRQPLVRPAPQPDHAQNVLPAWSPDGRRIAFVSMRSGNADIWAVNTDGTGLTNLTNDPSQDVSPAWSPDGAKIAFISDRAGTKQLYVMSAAGTGTRRLSDQEADRPTWSRLGFIACTVKTDSGFGIGLYDLNSPGPNGVIRILTEGAGENGSPAIAPNGRHIVFVTTRWGGRAQLAVIDMAGGHLRQLTDAGRNEHPNWGPIPGSR